MRIPIDRLRSDEALRRAGFSIVEELAPGQRFSADHGEHGACIVELFPGAAPSPQLRRHLSLRHRNLLSVLHVGEVAAVPCLCHERASGLSLADLRLGGPLPFELALEVLRQVAAGLAALHQAGLSHGRLRTDNVYDREDGQVALGPPLIAQGTAIQAAIQADLRRLGALFGELLAPSGAEAPAGDLQALLARLADPAHPAPRGTFELYALIEAAAQRGGLLGLDDSASITLPGGPPRPAGDAASPVDTGGVDDDTTIEVERLDATDLPAFLSTPVLADLVGPLERRQREAKDEARPARAKSDDKDDDDPMNRTMPILRLSGDTPAKSAPAPKEARALLTGSARWLVPLGLTAALTLALAAWVLLHAR